MPPTIPEGAAPDLDAASRGRLAALIAELREPARPDHRSAPQAPHAPEAPEAPREGVRRERLGALFPAVARRVARGPADPADPDGLRTPRLEDQARVALLRAAAEPRPPGWLAEETAALYRFGDADEKRAVLWALPELPLDPADAGLPLVADALRTNDPRLLAAALGPYAARHLDAASWRHGVLKCLFTGVPLAAVAGLADRADAELARMAADYRAERLAAGRPVPPDTDLLLDRDRVED